jgi:hypothetical protein
MQGRRLLELPLDVLRIALPLERLGPATLRARAQAVHEA